MPVCLRPEPYDMAGGWQVEKGRLLLSLTSAPSRPTCSFSLCPGDAESLRPLQKRLCQ